MSTLLILFCCIHIFAQNNKSGQLSLGLSAATNGFGITSALLLPSKDNYRQSIVVNLQTLKHPRETKVANQFLPNPTSYVFAKVNSAGSAQVTYHIQKQLGHSVPEKPSAFVGLAIGPSLGLLKPYYIRFKDPEMEGANPIVTQQNDQTMSNMDYVYGPDTWSKGFNEIKSQLGIVVSAAVTVNWSHSFYFQECKIGVKSEYYPNGMRILYNTDTKKFNSIFLAFSMGKR